MPREAIATDMVDVVLPLQGIAEGTVAMCKSE
jgi:chemotaxis response regulator CheB